MGLVARRQAAEPFETWPRMKDAAGERFWDGMTLGEAGREAGAIYLFGYVAEMLLKTAYCEYSGTADSVGLIAVLKTDMKNYSGSNPDLHSLRELSEFLIDIRAAHGDHMDAAVVVGLRQRVLIIESHRDVAMRYSASPANVDELNEVYASVEWIQLNYDALWS